MPKLIYSCLRSNNVSLSNNQVPAKQLQVKGAF